MIVPYQQSNTFNDETLEYFISGFESLHHRIMRVCLNLDLSMFKADVEFDSSGLEASKETEVELGRTTRPLKG